MKNKGNHRHRIALIAYISAFVALLSCIIILMFNHRQMSECALVGFEIAELTCYTYNSNIKSFVLYEKRQTINEI